MLFASVIGPEANTQNTNRTLLRQGTHGCSAFFCAVWIGGWSVGSMPPKSHPVKIAADDLVAGP